MADKIVSWGGFDSKGTDGMGVTGSLGVIFTTTTTVHGEGNTLLQLRGINGSSPGSNDGRLHIGYNQNDPELRLNSGGISVSTGKWTFLPQIWFAGGITSTHNTAFTLDGMTNGVTSGTAGDIIKFTQRNGQFASFYDAGNGLSEFRVWQQANSNNYIYLKPGQTSIFNLSPVTIKGTGTTSSTTAFSVQNSNASASFTVKDDRSATFAKEIYVDGDLGDGTGSIYLKNSAGDYSNRIGTYAYDTFISTRGTANSIQLLFGIGSGRALSFQGGGSGNIAISTANASLSINSVNDINHGSDLIKIESQNYNGGEGVVIARGRSTNLTDPIVTFKYETAEKVRINNSGNVGIGIPTPSASLHISGASSNVLLEIDSPAANNILYVSGSGNVGIGKSNPTYKLDVNGTINTGIGYGNFTTYSPDAQFGAAYVGEEVKAAIVTARSSPATYAGVTIPGGSSALVLGTSYGYDVGFGNYIISVGDLNVRVNNTTQALYANTSGQIGVGFSGSLSARLHVKGSGTTSSTTALLVQNANASSMLSLTDNGALTVNTFQTSSTAFTINRTNASMGGGNFNLATLGTLISINDTVGNSNGSKTTLYINSSGASINNAVEIYGGVGIGYAPYGTNFYVGYNTAIYNTARIQAATGFPLTSRDATQDYNTSTGGGISFWGDASGQGTGQSAYAGIRGLKANNTYVNGLGNLAFYVQTGSSHVITETTFREVGRFNELGYFGIGTSTPTSTLHVKGSTTVYASSSLKVENSTTSGSFKVTDTGKLFLAVNNPEGYTVPQAASSASMYIYEGPGNSGRAGITLHSGQSANNGSYLHLFNYISHWASGIQHYSSGGGAIQKMRFYIGYDASQQLGDAGNVMTVSSNGLGLNTLAAEITANLQVKGYGTTSSTKSLLVQDSAGSAILEAYDSGYVVVRQEKGINLASSINEWDNIKSIANSSLTLNPYWGVKVNGTYPSGIDTANIPLLHVTRTLAGPLSPLAKFEDSGSTRFIVTNSGSVGIGTANPAANLHTIGSNEFTQIVQSTTDVAYTQYYNSSTGTGGTNDGLTIGVNNTYGVVYLRENSDLIFGTANTERIRITSTGNLGVGTSSPSARIHILGSGTTTSTKTFLLQNSSNTQLGYVDDSGRWQIGQGTNSGYALEVSGSARISSTNGGYKLILKTTGEGNGAGLLVDQLGYTMLDVNASDVYMKTFPGSTSKLDFWNYNNYGGPTNTFFIQNSQYHVSLNSPDNYKIPIVKFPDATVPIIMGNIATSAIRGYLTVGGAFYASASLGASQRIVSTVSAIANNDTLIGLDVQPTFANGAYTGVTNYALRVSGSTYLYKSGSTVLDVQGSSGQLFSVTDSLSGSLFSVNTVAGLPVIEAFSDNRVNIGKYGNYNVAISGSTTTVTGSLVVNGSDITTAWTSYTPTWTSDSTPPSLGNGTLTGAYKVIGKTCFVRVRLVWGTTTTNGTGVFYFDLPVSASTSWGIQMPASILDNGNAWYQATANGEYGGFTNKVALIGQSAGGANSSQGVAFNFPIGFSNLDSIQFAGSYEIA